MTAVRSLTRPPVSDLIGKPSIRMPAAKVSSGAMARGCDGAKAGAGEGPRVRGAGFEGAEWCESSRAAQWNAADHGRRLSPRVEPPLVLLSCGRSGGRALLRPQVGDLVLLHLAVQR